MSEKITIPVIQPLKVVPVDELFERWEVLPPADPTFWEFLRLPFMEQLKCLAWRFLASKGVVYTSIESRRNFNFQKITIDLEKLDELVFEHAREVQGITGRRPTDILIGRDVFPAFQAANYPVQFQVPTGKPLYAIAGMKVTYLPWMEGFVLINRHSLL